MRRIRKIVAYACTTCFALFSDARVAKAHARTHPAPRANGSAAPGKARRTQTGAILGAIGKGATTAEAVARQTRIPLDRVHSLLSYHRRKGNVKGFSGELKLAR